MADRRCDNNVERAKRLKLARALCTAMSGDGDIRQVVTLLNEDKADPNTIVPELCMTPFHIAAGHENVAFGKIASSLILHCGGDPNKKCCDGGQTVLHVAVAWNRWHVVQALLKGPYITADPRIKDDDGLTAFDYAIKFSAWESLAELRSQNEKNLASNQNRYGTTNLNDYTMNSSNDAYGDGPSIVQPDNYRKTNMSSFSGYSGSESSLDSSSSVVAKTNAVDSDCIDQSAHIDSFARSLELSSIHKATEEDILNKNITSELSEMYRHDDSKRLMANSLSIRSMLGNDCLIEDYSCPLMDTYCDSKFGISFLDAYSDPFKDDSVQNEPKSTNYDWMMTDVSGLSSLATDSGDEYYTCPEKNSLDNSKTSSSQSIDAINNAIAQMSIDGYSTSRFISKISTGANSIQVTNLSFESSNDSSSLTEVTDDCDTDDLRQSLRRLGNAPGPIPNAGTKRLYLRHLKRLLNNVQEPKQDLQAPVVDDFLDGSYSNQLTEVLTAQSTWKSQITEWSGLEDKIVCDKSGSSFTYLLLDPRVTKNLPGRADSIDQPIDVWRTFVKSIFYVGKGTNSRPNDHMREAFNEWVGASVTVKNSSGRKIQYILDVWRENKGVVCVQAFHHLTPKEAHIREAAMIDAMGLDKLTNEKRGTYYDQTTRWRGSDKCKLGCYLLYRAMLVFLADGERQLRPVDLT
ncbi:uncharacterized protein LOC126847730 [Adelges cooleyi]|uniref:uncharacterized protein LOC126847730 n=1 Tax=Adelges cooleyi TaxID=133065 RepID=UPI00217F7221|nr:uncharacterized protein LOC126847730 [Adelges cooleyi]